MHKGTSTNQSKQAYLQVAMDNMPLVTVVDARNDLMQEQASAKFGNGPILVNLITQITSLANVHDNFVVFSVLKQLVHFENVLGTNEKV
jgi:hypothetical protein